MQPNKKKFSTLLLLLLIISCSSPRTAVYYNNRAMDILSKDFTGEDNAVAAAILKNLDLAIKMDSNYQIAYYNKLRMLTSLKRFPAALELIAVMTKKQKKKGMLILVSGIILDEMNEPDLAKSRYLQAEDQLEEEGDYADAVVAKFLRGDSLNSIRKIDSLFMTSRIDSVAKEVYRDMFVSKDRKTLRRMFL